MIFSEFLAKHLIFQGIMYTFHRTSHLIPVPRTSYPHPVPRTSKNKQQKNNLPKSLRHISIIS